ncbi:MAG: hypothetical protein WAM28_03180 [Chlamydiales bacterium]
MRTKSILSNSHQIDLLPVGTLQSSNINRLENRILLICNRTNSADSLCQKTARKVFKGIAIFASSSAKIFFVPVSLTLGQRIGEAGKVIGPICAISNSASFFTLEYTVARGVINDLLSTKANRENELFPHEQDTKKICKKITIISTSGLISLFSQVPPALAVFHYNAPQVKIIAAGVTLIAGALFPMRSVQLSLDHLTKQFSRATQPKLLAMKKEMCKLIKESHELFIKEDLSQKSEFIKALDQIRKDNDSQRKVNQYLLNAIHPQNLLQPTQPSKIRKYVNYSGQAVGLVLTGILQYGIAEYTYELTKQEISDSDATAATLAAVSVASNVYLMGTSIINTTRKVFDSTWGWISNTRKRSLAEQLRPKLTFSLKSFGLILNALALGPSVVIWGDFYQGSSFQGFFESSICTATFLLLFTATLDVVDDVVESLVLSKGTQGEKEIIQMDQEFKQLLNLLEESSLADFQVFFDDLPPETREHLLGRLKLDIDQINSYLNPVEME